MFLCFLIFSKRDLYKSDQNSDQSLLSLCLSLHHPIFIPELNKLFQIPNLCKLSKQASNPLQDLPFKSFPQSQPLKVPHNRLCQGPHYRLYPKIHKLFPVQPQIQPSDLPFDILAKRPKLFGGLAIKPLDEGHERLDDLGVWGIHVLKSLNRLYEIRTVDIVIGEPDLGVIETRDD